MLKLILLTLLLFSHPTGPTISDLSWIAGDWQTAADVRKSRNIGPALRVGR